MQCPSCGEDRSPIIEGGQSGRFTYTCGNSSCHVNLGPVVREHSAPPPTPTSTSPQVAAPTIGIADLGASLVDSIRERLALLDRELAKAVAMRTERTMLVRMLKAAERTDKKVRDLTVSVTINGNDDPSRIAQLIDRGKWPQGAS